MKNSLVMASVLVSTFLFGCATKDLRVQQFEVAAGTPDPTKPPEFLPELKVALRL